jgi:hypothetical protein
MYENTFNLGFLTNFLFGFIFITINIIFSIKISKNIFIKKIFFFEEFQPLIIFFLIFSLYTLIFNLTSLINHSLISELFFIIFFFKIILILRDLKAIKSLFKFNINLNEKIILIIFFILFLISILPISDADSISVFQHLPLVIFNEGFDKINLQQNIEFTSFSSTEIILLISPILKSDNFGSQLNLLTLLFFITLRFKSHKNFSYIILSSPLIIYFISAQKLQLFFGVLFLLLFVVVNKNLFFKKKNYFIFILLLIFYSSGKLSYILLTIPLFIYFFYRHIKNWRIIILYSTYSVVLVYAPLFILKQIYFGNILAPFFDNIIGQNSDIYNAYAYSLRATEGWLNNAGNLSIYLRPFVSFEVSKLSSSLGLVFLLMLINFKLQKDTKFIPIFLIIIILSTGQILPRYYFEAFLILAFFYKPQHSLIKLFIYSQVFVIFSISIMYAYLGYIKFEVIKDKTKYMEQFSYSYFNAEQHKNDGLMQNVLDFSLDRQSIFFNTNVYSTRFLNTLNQFNNQNFKNFNNFIINNSIKYLIINDDKNFPDCIITEEIKETYRKQVIRNFLIKPEKNKYKILKIKDNKCKY